MDGRDPAGGAPRPPDGAPLAPVAQRRWPLGHFFITAFGSFEAALLISVAVSSALGIAQRAPESRTPLEILLVTAASDAALLLALALLGRRLLRLTAADLGFRRPRLPDLRRAAAFGLGLWVASILVNLVSIRLFGPRPQSLVVSFGAHQGPDAFVLDLLTGTVIAPVAEETLFRGLIFAGLAQRMPFAAAAAISALLFALTHGIGVLLPIFALGFGLAWIYRRSGTLWAPIVAHAVVNAVSLVLLFTLSDLARG